jgi:hypothetical protein
MFMEDESVQKTKTENAPNLRDELMREEFAAKPSSHGMRDAVKGLRWGVWVMILLIGFLLVSSIANLVVSQRAYESSRKQVRAIEQLTQSIKDIQRSIVELSKMIEQPSLEDEEPEEDREPAGDGSI